MIMKSIVDSLEIRDMVVSLINDHSVSEIASIVKVSHTTVHRVIRKYGIKRNSESEASVRSRIRKGLVRDERRRALFGFDQHTKIKVFHNRECAKLKYCLKRRSYIFLKRGDKIAYYDSTTNRHPGYEKKGLTLGLKFFPINQQIS